ncbi:phage baseplate assembly protein V [Pantoea ananatis]|uniref:phage baseplate assembly protein V n=1 Tax=Pantoea ananas TaxID=553 RepID=UPI001B30F8D3|nr:phage baseplate assembly protein V [Pantoea ananatis]
MNEQILEIKRLLRNMVRIGTVAAINLEAGTCRVKIGDNTTDWLHWLSARAGRTRSWNAPSPGEQVLIISLGGELNSGFVLPGVFSDASPAPSASADALHYSFPDGAVIEYEPATGALKAEGIQTATIKAAVKILLDTPEVECTTLLKTATLEVTQGGTMKGDVSHSGGSFASNGKVLHTHQHPGDSGGTTGAPL